MDGALAASYERGRRVLAGGTANRFLVLLCVLLVSCVSMFSTMAFALRSGSFQDCVLVAAATDLDGLLHDLYVRDNETFQECRSDVVATSGRYATVGTGAVLLAALLLYWWLPAWRTRGNRLLPAAAFRTPQPPGGQRTSSLAEELARLSRHAGLSRQPEFLVDPRAMTVGAVAFGRVGRYAICLHAGLIPRRFTDPRVFKAVVLHELAHVRRRDVDLAYLTVIFWRVLLFAVLLPYLALLGWKWLTDDALEVPATWMNATPTAGKVAFALVLAALAYLARAEVMRCRELCADVDAVLLDADPAVWGSPHLARPACARTSRVAAAARWFGGLWRSHPTWQQRLWLLSGAAPLRTDVTFLQTLLVAGTAVLLFFVAFGSAWPLWLFAAVLYLTGPLMVIAFLGHVPSKSPPPPIQLRPAKPDPWNTPVVRRAGSAAPPAGRRREWGVVWGFGLLAAVIGTLFVIDPLGGFDRDRSLDSIGTLSEPPEYQPEPASWPIAGPEERVGRTLAEVSAWLAGGGRDVGTRLFQTIAFEPAEVTSLETHANHCTAARQAVADAEALFAPADLMIRLDWHVLVLSTHRGTDLRCADGPTGRQPPDAAKYYTIARQAYREVALWVNLYAPGSLPD